MRWFEWTQYAIFGLGLINWALTYDHQRELAAAAGRGPAVIVTAVLLGFGILLLFVWLIAYRRSSIAKWIFVGLNGLGLLVLLNIKQLLAQNGTASVSITVIQSSLSLFSLWMLFRRDSRDWFARSRPVDPEIFR
jgi:hypothetical protein